MSPCCPNCSSIDIETDPQRGDSVCIQCGTVIEENAIVNEVRFVERVATAVELLLDLAFPRRVQAVRALERLARPLTPKN